MRPHDRVLLQLVLVLLHRLARDKGETYKAGDRLLVSDITLCTVWPETRERHTRWGTGYWWVTSRSAPSGQRQGRDIQGGGQATGEWHHALHRLARDKGETYKAGDRLLVSDITLCTVWPERQKRDIQGGGQATGEWHHALHRLARDKGETYKEWDRLLVSDITLCTVWPERQGRDIQGGGQATGEWHHALHRLARETRERHTRRGTGYWWVTSRSAPSGQRDKGETYKAGDRLLVSDITLCTVWPETREAYKRQGTGCWWVTSRSAPSGQRDKGDIQGGDRLLVSDITLCTVWPERQGRDIQGGGQATGEWHHALHRLARDKGETYKAGDRLLVSDITLCTVWPETRERHIRRGTGYWWVTSRSAPSGQRQGRHTRRGTGYWWVTSRSAPSGQRDKGETYKAGDRLLVSDITLRTVWPERQGGDIQGGGTGYWWVTSHSAPSGQRDKEEIYKAGDRLLVSDITLCTVWPETWGRHTRRGTGYWWVTSRSAPSGQRDKGETYKAGDRLLVSDITLCTVWPETREAYKRQGTGCWWVTSRSAPSGQRQGRHTRRGTGYWWVTSRSAPSGQRDKGETYKAGDRLLVSDITLRTVWPERQGGDIQGGGTGYWWVTSHSAPSGQRDKEEIYKAGDRLLVSDITLCTVWPETWGRHTRRGTGYWWVTSRSAPSGQRDKGETYKAGDRLLVSDITLCTVWPETREAYKRQGTGCWWVTSRSAPSGQRQGRHTRRGQATGEWHHALHRLARETRARHTRRGTGYWWVTSRSAPSGQRQGRDIQGGGQAPGEWHHALHRLARDKGETYKAGDRLLVSDITLCTVWPETREAYKAGYRLLVSDITLCTVGPERQGRDIQGGGQATGEWHHAPHRLARETRGRHTRRGDRLLVSDITLCTVWPERQGRDIQGGGQATGEWHHTLHRLARDMGETYKAGDRLLVSDITLCTVWPERQGRDIQGGGQATGKWHHALHRLARDKGGIQKAGDRLLVSDITLCTVWPETREAYKAGYRLLVSDITLCTVGPERQGRDIQGGGQATGEWHHAPHRLARETRGRHTRRGDRLLVSDITLCTVWPERQGRDIQGGGQATGEWHHTLHRLARDMGETYKAGDRLLVSDITLCTVWPERQGRDIQGGGQATGKWHHALHRLARDKGGIQKAGDRLLVSDITLCTVWPERQGRHTRRGQATGEWHHALHRLARETRARHTRRGTGYWWVTSRSAPSGQRQGRDIQGGGQAPGEWHHALHRLARDKGETYKAGDRLLVSDITLCTVWPETRERHTRRGTGYWWVTSRSAPSGQRDKGETYKAGDRLLVSDITLCTVWPERQGRDIQGRGQATGEWHHALHRLARHSNGICEMGCEAILVIMILYYNAVLEN